MPWYWLDIGIVIIVGLSMLTGLFRGFVKELIALCVWVLAIWLAFTYSQALDPWLQKYLQDKTARAAVAFVLILVCTLIAGGIVNAVIGLILRHSGLSGTDRILGMGFGFVRGVFIVGLLMVMVKLTSLPYEQYRRDSQLYAKFDPLVDWLYGFMPQIMDRVKVLDKNGQIIDIKPSQGTEASKPLPLQELVPVGSMPSQSNTPAPSRQVKGSSEVPATGGN